MLKGISSYFWWRALMKLWGVHCSVGKKIRLFHQVSILLWLSSVQDWRKNYKVKPTAQIQLDLTFVGRWRGRYGYIWIYICEHSSQNIPRNLNNFCEQDIKLVTYENVIGNRRKRKKLCAITDKLVFVLMYVKQRKLIFFLENEKYYYWLDKGGGFVVYFLGGNEA